MAARPFEIHVSDDVLEDLRDRLSRTRWPDSGLSDGWAHGADPAYIRELCEYWRTDYDWRSREAELNRFPQFVSTVDGVDFHYYHVRGKGPNPMPLLLVHGWPGSVFEFHDLIDPLTDPASHGGNAADSFDVVVPALPGYGWSSKPREPGWGPTRTAAAFDTLMTRELGYGKYGTQGGDWGGIITAKMGASHGDHIVGVHLSMMFVIGPRPAEISPEDAIYVMSQEAFRATETAYNQLQATKPTSLAIAQTDSPAGIAAWIVEKFRSWSDCDGRVESVFSRDRLLTNIMFYWAPNSIDSAARMYYEAQRDADAFSWERINVPVAVAAFAKEIYQAPRRWCEARVNLARWTEFDKGGHFPAMERPLELTHDIREFFRPLR
jgi:microsomal epoxide hydrolase